MAKRRTLKLTNGGRFVFTAKTWSVDVSEVFDVSGKPSPAGSYLLHVGRTKAALEHVGHTVDELELDAAVEILERLAVRIHAAGGPPLREACDPRLWADVQRQAKHLRAARVSSAPFGGRRSRRCFETVGGHPGESLWVDLETGEAAVETRVDELDEKGRSVGYTSSVRFVTPAAARQWLETDGVRYLPATILETLDQAARRGRK